MNANVLSKMSHFVSHPGVRTSCCVLLLLPVDCHLAVTMSIYLISSHTSLPGGVHIDPQRETLIGQ